MPRNYRLAFALLPLLGGSAYGQSWSHARFNVPEVNAAFGIAYGKGRFVAGVQGGGQGARMVWSVDGVTWQQSALLGSSESLAFFNDAFYNPSGSGVYRSADGVTWEQIHRIPPGSSVQRAAHSGRGMMLDHGRRDGTLDHSADMVTWRTTTRLPNAAAGSESTINAIAFGAGRYFVSYSLTNAGAFNGGYTASSVDGQSWVLVPEFRNARVMAGGNGRFVAVAGSFAYITTDGTTFTQAAVPADLAGIGVPGTSFSPANSRLVFAGGRFVALPRMHASTDGVNWSVLAPFDRPSSTQIFSLAYGNGRYFAVGWDIPPGASNGVDVLASLAAAAPPIIATQPVPAAAAEGQRATFSVAIDNPDLHTTFAWRRDGVAIPGATSPRYTIDLVSAASAGRYSVEIRNAIGTSMSEPVQLTVVPAAQAGRLINLSVLSSLDTPDSNFTAGFVVGGAGTIGTKTLLVRAGGPSLTTFGIGNANADPRLELFSPGGKSGDNDNWGGGAILAAAFTQVGAFPYLSTDSKDAALLSTTVPKGDNSARVSTNQATGAVIAEVYDATPPADFTATTPRLINVSVLKSLTAGGSISAGFVLGGSTSKTVLIRAIGPTLASFGVPGSLADPSLVVYRQGVATAIASNDNWGGTAELQAAISAVGAFELNPGSRDAAVLLSLAPGGYTAQIFADAAGGAALVEIYEMP